MHISGVIKLFKEIKETLQREITKKACLDDICQNNQQKEFKRKDK